MTAIVDCVPIFVWPDGNEGIELIICTPRRNRKVAIIQEKWIKISEALRRAIIKLQIRDCIITVECGVTRDAESTENPIVPATYIGNSAYHNLASSSHSYQRRHFH